MKLAVKKDTSGSNPLGGFHYMLHPMAMSHDHEAAVYELMGYVIVEVDPERGENLLRSARKALGHQVEVAFLTESALTESALKKTPE